MPEPTEPTPPTPGADDTQPTPAAEAPATEAPAPARSTIGRNLALGIAAAALVLGGLIGAVAANVLHDDGRTDRIGFGGRGDQMVPGERSRGDGDRDRMPMGPRGPEQGGPAGPGGRRGVDPDGGGRPGRDQLPRDGTAPSTSTTAPAAPGA